MADGLRPPAWKPEEEAHVINPRRSGRAICRRPTRGLHCALSVFVLSRRPHYHDPQQDGVDRQQYQHAVNYQEGRSDKENAECRSCRDVPTYVAETHML